MMAVEQGEKEEVEEDKDENLYPHLCTSICCSNRIYPSVSLTISLQMNLLLILPLCTNYISDTMISNH